MSMRKRFSVLSVDSLIGGLRSWVLSILLARMMAFSMMSSGYPLRRKCEAKSSELVSKVFNVAAYSPYSEELTLGKTAFAVHTALGEPIHITNSCVSQ